MSIEVSVVTPTYNRRQFIPILIEIYKNQTYPKEKMEWIIIDDGRDKVEDLFIEASKTIPNIRYIYKDEKLRMGEKRNALNDEARGEIIIAMDDDDYYPPKRVETVVKAFKNNPKIDVVGSSAMYMYYNDTKLIYKLGPFGKNHSTNATMAWRKKYSNTHRYNDFVTQAEEAIFLDNYKVPILQLDPLQTILVICHSDNTVDKYKLRATHTEGKNSINLFTITKYKLQDFVKEKSIRDFYLELSTA
jgi:glycosyltransferase involved in cell wall biosynthesis